MHLIHVILHSCSSNHVFSVDWDHAVLNLTGLRPADAIYPLMYSQSVAHSLPRSLPSSLCELQRKTTPPLPS